MGQHQAHLSVYTKIAQHEANLPIDEQQHDEISQSTVSVVLAHGCSEERRKSTSAQLMFLPAHNRYSPFDPDLRSLSIFPFTRIQLTVARWKNFLIHRRGRRGTDRSPISPSTVYTWALAISHDTFPVDRPQKRRKVKGESSGKDISRPVERCSTLFGY